MTKKKIKIGQAELDEYKFDRQDIALMLGKTTNAIRMMMRKSNCTLNIGRTSGVQNVYIGLDRQKRVILIISKI